MPDASLRRLRIMEFDQQMRLSEVVKAERGVYSGPGAWELSGVSTTHYRQIETTEPLPLMRTEIASAATRVWNSELTPALLSVLMVMPERMSAINLFNYIRHLRENQQNTELHEIAFWKKVVYPLAVIVMMADAISGGRPGARRRRGHPAPGLRADRPPGDPPRRAPGRGPAWC